MQGQSREDSGQSRGAQRQQVVLRDDDPRRAELEADGWSVVARSWGARLTESLVDSTELKALVQRGRHHGDVRTIDAADVEAVLTLDSATLTDYPGGVATQHDPLTESRVLPTQCRQGFGIFNCAGRALAMTFVDLSEYRAETDFTVVDSELRGLGLGSAVKAASVLLLVSNEFREFRTGGAAENTAILATNRRLGYVIDEQWFTLAPPA